jgi:hypothetical protein
MVKMAFTFDEETVARLRQAAARLARPQSFVVREAVREYAERIGSLSEQERRHLLKAVDTVIPAIPPRSLSEVRAKITEVRAARHRASGRHRRSRRARQAGHTGAFLTSWQNIGGVNQIQPP